MKNLRLSTRLALLSAVLIALILLTGGVSMLTMRATNDDLKAVYQDRTVPLGQLLDVQRLILRNRVAITRAAAIDSPDAMQAGLAEVEKNAAAIGTAWDAYMTSRQTSEEASYAHDFASRWQSYVTEFMTPAVNAMRASDTPALRGLLREKETSLYSSVQQAVAQLAQTQLDIARTIYLDSASRASRIRVLAWVLFGGGALFGVFFTWALIRGVRAALGGVIRASHAIARGDLTQEIPTQGGNEIALLQGAVLGMQRALRDVVSSVREHSEAVAIMSAQIAQGNEDLSARTESQASALQETAASMEELASTVRQNADNARQANGLAQSASSIALEGGEVVAQVVDTMKGISDSSQKIADIIGVIDGIAFQTNILALNAAVEAARAGEQGRGFAVVAGEVRALAGRSAEAAKEIKGLITDSAQRVDAGTQLVNRAGGTMNDVVTSIQRVAAIMGEISSASAQQSAGVGQVGEAVSSIDQATQQNAALVEEMAAAASSLRSQAHDLVQAVAIFRLDRHGDSDGKRQPPSPEPSSGMVLLGRDRTV